MAVCSLCEVQIWFAPSDIHPRLILARFHKFGSGISLIATNVSFLGNNMSLCSCSVLGCRRTNCLKIYNCVACKNLLFWACSQFFAPTRVKLCGVQTKMLLLLLTTTMMLILTEYESYKCSLLCYYGATLCLLICLFLGKFQICLCCCMLYTFAIPSDLTVMTCH